MSTLTDALDAAAEKASFSGVVSVLGGEEEIGLAYGLANRSTGTPITVDTRFGVASGSKGMTALVVASLVEGGALGLGTAARDLLGPDLPLIDDGVTVRHLLSHTSGIGDYIDEDAEDYDTDSYVLRRPVQEYLSTADFLPDLEGHPQAFAPGDHFAYCNGGFMVLALIAERASGERFHDLVRTRVLEPAGMTDSGFFRSDRLPTRTALGYLSEDEDAVSNVFHLPILGSGDGGLYTTAADCHRFWSALLTGAILPERVVTEMISPQVAVDDDPDYAYGLGFWLKRNPVSQRWDPNLQGEDAGFSFISRHDLALGTTRTALASTTEGAWEMWPVLRES